MGWLASYYPLHEEHILPRDTAAAGPGCRPNESYRLKLASPETAMEQGNEIPEARLPTHEGQWTLYL